MKQCRWMLAVCLLLVPFCEGLLADDELQQTEIAEPFIELHTGPGRGFPVFYIAERGQKITLIKKKTQWFKVRTEDGNEGWVHENKMGLTLASNGENFDPGKPEQVDFQRRDFEAGVMTGDYGGATALTLYGGWNWTENISSELSLTQALGNVSDIRFATINIVHQPFPEWRYSPYFKIGTGIINTKPHATLIQAVDRTDETVHVGGGIKIWVSRQFFIRAEYNAHTILTSRDDNDKVEEWKLGFSVFF